MLDILRLNSTPIKIIIKHCNKHVPTVNSWKGSHHVSGYQFTDCRNHQAHITRNSMTIKANIIFITLWLKSNDFFFWSRICSTNRLVPNLNTKNMKKNPDNRSPIPQTQSWLLNTFKEYADGNPAINATITRIDTEVFRLIL